MDKANNQAPGLTKGGALAKTKVMDMDKVDLKAAAIRAARAMVEAGEVSILDEYIYAKKLEEFVKTYRDELNTEAEQECFEENNHETARHKVKASVVNGSTLLDYDKDPEIVRLKKLIKDRQDLLKTRHKMGSQGHLQTVDPETGEEVEVPFVPAKPSAAQVLKIQLQ